MHPNPGDTPRAHGPHLTREIPGPAAQVPVVVGFGVKDADTARQVAEVADGVVVGSAFINAVEARQDVGALADEIAAGCRR